MNMRKKKSFGCKRMIRTHPFGTYCEASTLGCGHTGRVVCYGYSPLGIKEDSKIYPWGDVCEIIDELVESQDDPDLKESWNLWKKEIDIVKILDEKYAYTGWEYKLYMDLPIENIDPKSFNYEFYRAGCIDHYLKPHEKLEREKLSDEKAGGKMCYIKSHTRFEEDE